MARGGKPPVVIESERLQTDPAGQIRRYWQAMGLSDTPQALDWNEPAPKDWEQVSAWHRDVMARKSIRPYTEDEAGETREMFNKLVARQPRIQSDYEHHAAFYARLVRSAI